MGLKTTRILPGLFLLILSGGLLQAAPKLRLTSTTVGPVLVNQGANGAAQAVDAGNAGDGSLNLTATANVSWIGTSIGAARSCALFGSCRPVQIALNTASLTRGTYTGVVTVNDPNAVDAPQTITVTVQVGSAVPDKADFLAAPNGSPATLDFTTGSKLTTKVTTQGGIPWLAISQAGGGSFSFSIPYRITATPVAELSEGSYTGSIVTSDSTAAADNKIIPVTFKVTTQPIAAYSTDPVRFRIAQGSPKQLQYAAISNSGQGTLSISGATPASSGGNWLTAGTVSGFSGISVTADPGNLAPGIYQGSVAVASNAANSSVTIPVQLEVVAQGAPQASFGGAVYNGVFQPTDTLAQGAIVALFGEQFSYAAPAGAASLPLGTDLGGTRVFINDVPVPIFYASYNQVNFQVPYNATAGDATIRVERSGQRGNSISTRIVAASPKILLYGDYAIAVNPDGSLAVPASLGGRPVRRGEAIVIYAVGLGPTTPAVTAGTAAPANPLATVPGIDHVIFGGGGGFSGEGVSQPVIFAGLTPNFVGLYQINVVVPDNAPVGDNVPLSIGGNAGGSNRVKIAIQ